MMRREPTIQDLLKALKTGNEKTSIRPNYIPPMSLAFLESEVSALNHEIDIDKMVEPLKPEATKNAWIDHAMHGRFENPVFEYDTDKLSEVAGKEAKVCELLTLVDDYFPNEIREQFEIKMMIHTLNDIYSSVEIAKSMLLHDDKATAKQIRKKFGAVPDFVKKLRFNKQPEDIEIQQKKFDAEDIVNAFYLAQDYYGFNWPVVISDDSTESTDGKKIVIPRGRVVDSYQLLRLIGHEIESYLRSSMNGLVLFGFGGLNLKTDNEELSEGLAMLSDRDFDLWRKGTYENEVARYYAQAVKMAMDGADFANVAESLWKQRRHETRALEKAYNMARRVFRGVTDTSNPAGFAFTKEIAYYNGLNQAIELEAQGCDWLLELGSFDLNQLELIAKYFRLSPQMVPYKRIDLKKNRGFLKNLGLI